MQNFLQQKKPQQVCSWDETDVTGHTQTQLKTKGGERASKNEGWRGAVGSVSDS